MGLTDEEKEVFDRLREIVFRNRRLLDLSEKELRELAKEVPFLLGTISRLLLVQDASGHF